MNLLLFLGGTVNKSTWRSELIPLLEYENIAYFNPVVPDWDDESFERELFIKSLPSTVELYVISKEMSGPYSVAEAVESSNKKPEKTIFYFIPEGMSSDQINSLRAVEKIVEENKAYIAKSFYEIVYIFKSICLNINQDIINNKISSKKIIKDLSPDEVLNLTGIEDFLKDMYVDLSDLGEEYTDVFINKIKKYLKNPLFKDISINDSSDLRFLRQSMPFKEYLSDIIDDIKTKLISRQSRVEKIIKTYEKKSEINLSKLLKETNLDKTSLLFILHELKENNKIYDYNGRNLTLL